MSTLHQILHAPEKQSLKRDCFPLNRGPPNCKDLQASLTFLKEYVIRSCIHPLVAYAHKYILHTASSDWARGCGRAGLSGRLEGVRNRERDLDPALDVAIAGADPGGAMGSADEVNIQASELNRTLKVASGISVSILRHSDPPHCLCMQAANPFVTSSAFGLAELCNHHTIELCSCMPPCLYIIFQRWDVPCSDWLGIGLVPQDRDQNKTPWWPAGRHILHV